MVRPRDARGRFQSKTPARAAIEKDGEGGSSGDFLTELQASWAKHGAATIDEVRTGRPHDYLRLMASSLPKPVAAGKADAIEAMSDDEIADELRHILGKLAAAGVDPGV